MNTGKVKWFAEDKGYGFITDSGTNIDYFAHISEVKSKNYEDYLTLEKGQKVTFELKTSNRGNGYKCINIQIVK